jgi:hypothetical protein
MKVNQRSQRLTIEVPPLKFKGTDVRSGSRLCENVRKQRMRRIVFSFFFFRRFQPALFFFLINLIETKVLRASSTSEFSHSLGQSRHFDRGQATSGRPR